MAFSSPRVNVIESTDGYSVEVLGRVGIRYIEGGRVAYISSECLLSDPPSIAVLMRDSYTKWEDGHPMDDSARTRVLRNMEEAFQWQGAKVVVCGM